MMTLLRVLLLAIGLVFGLEAIAQAQMPAAVRVVESETPIRRWFNPANRDVIAVVEPGTTLAVLDKEDGWYWIVAPPDAHGTRRAGWIAARHVEAIPMPVEAAAPPCASLPGESDVQPAPMPLVTERPAHEESPTPEVRTIPKHYDFEDVLFDRDRYSLRPGSTGPLDAAVTALGSDSQLRLTIEGHTCSLGTAAYNLALAHRRAAAVKDYLVNRGVPADRLRTVGHGEERPMHDNSREETRSLNRRVVLIPLQQ